MLVRGCSVAVSEPGRMQMLAEGTQAPEWSGSDQDGNTVSSAGLAGRWVAMWWYPKAATPG